MMIYAYVLDSVLSKHDNIVHLIGYQEYPENIIIMEMCDDNLLNFLGELQKSLKPSDIEVFAHLDIKFQAIKEIAAGIAEIHRCGIIHFDIKSQNILVKRKPDGKYIFKISDFGVS
jgi:serine/threonine protein kinase